MAFIQDPLEIHSKYIENLYGIVLKFAQKAQGK